MMVEMGEMGPDVILPDERAAGVISGSDPYRELELYLEKVNVSITITPPYRKTGIKGWAKVNMTNVTALC